MPFVTLLCPQCSAPLPRQAHWRMVTCLYCHASVTNSQEVVEYMVGARDDFAASQVS